MRKNIKLEHRLEARDAANLSNYAKKYKNQQIYIEKDNRTVNIYSIFGLLSLEITGNEEITIIAENKETIEDIINFLKRMDNNG